MGCDKFNVCVVLKGPFDSCYSFTLTDSPKNALKIILNVIEYYHFHFLRYFIINLDVTVSFSSSINPVQENGSSITVTLHIDRQILTPFTVDITGGMGTVVMLIIGKQ